MNQMTQSAADKRFSFVAWEESLHEQARQLAGSDDFGDPSYLEGLRVLLAAYDRESRLSPAGQEWARGRLLNILRNRPRAQRMWKDHPAILRTEIRRPLFILGIIRTGTTALHHLLSQDPASQVLEYWLATAPQPRPPREQWERHPDYQRAIREIDWMYEGDPSLKAIHLMLPDTAEECLHLLQQSFTDDTFDATATIPSYSAWYAQVDMVPSYARHRDLLKLIGYHTPERRWLLKYPAHLAHLRALLTVYPDACIVHPHRDPCEVMSSACSLLAGFRALYESDVDRAAIARWTLDLWATRMDRYVALRRKCDPQQFFDAHFREILSDPVGVARRVYDHFGLQWTDAAERHLRRWHAENPRGKHGEHVYRAEDFGLDNDMVAERFSKYMRYFNLERSRGG